MDRDWENVVVGGAGRRGGACGTFKLSSKGEMAETLRLKRDVIVTCEVDEG